MVPICSMVSPNLEFLYFNFLFWGLDFVYLIKRLNFYHVCAFLSKRIGDIYRLQELHFGNPYKLVLVILLMDYLTWKNSVTYDTYIFSSDLFIRNHDVARVWPLGSKVEFVKYLLLFFVCVVWGTKRLQYAYSSFGNFFFTNGTYIQIWAK